jgi:hypothetical protein
MEYARKYWGLEVPIFNDDNEIVRYEKVKFGKYRLYQGWDPKKGGGPPPGQTQFNSAVSSYAQGFFQKKKPLELRVKNIWGSEMLLTFRTWGEFLPLLPRATQAFSGKGSPEDVQLTLQLAARCGIVAPGGLQAYCDEPVDPLYPRLGLDCNGFVGNYLRYRNSGTPWWHIDPVSSSTIINGDMGIGSIVKKVSPEPVKNVKDMLAPRMHVLGMVDKTGNVIDGGFNGVGHIMITQAHNWGMQEALPPIPKGYLGKRFLCYSGVEATPAVGLSDFKYTILNIAANGVATVWRDKVFGAINVKIYPVS